jgi:transposase-like protein
MGVNRGIYSNTESAHTLDVNKLVKTIKVAIKENFTKNSEGEDISAKEVSEAIEHNLKLFKVDSQSFEFFSIPNKLGGCRWMAKCPKCESPVLKMYKPNEGDPYLCKDCHKLRSPSALYGPTRRYKEIVRPMRRMERIKEILATSNLSEAKTKSLLDEHDKLHRDLQESTFYRKSRLLNP